MLRIAALVWVALAWACPAAAQLGSLRLDWNAADRDLHDTPTWLLRIEAAHTTDDAIGPVFHELYDRACISFTWYHEAPMIWLANHGLSRGWAYPLPWDALDDPGDAYPAGTHVWPWSEAVSIAAAAGHLDRATLRGLLQPDHAHLYLAEELFGDGPIGERHEGWGNPSLTYWAWSWTTGFPVLTERLTVERVPTDDPFSDEAAQLVTERVSDRYRPALLLIAVSPTSQWVYGTHARKGFGPRRWAEGNFIAAPYRQYTYDLRWRGNEPVFWSARLAWVRPQIEPLFPNDPE